MENKRIAFSPCEELQPDGGVANVNGLYQEMMNLFDSEIALVINERVNAALSGDYQEQDVIKQIMDGLVVKDMEKNTLHDYLSLYNSFLRAVDTYARNSTLGGLLSANGFDPKRLSLYWFPGYTRNLKSRTPPYYRPQAMIQTLSVSFVIASEVMCLCQYATGVRDALKFAFLGSKRLQFTWADYFNYLYATHSSIASTVVYNVINLMLQGGSAILNPRKLTDMECVGVAFADYAYGRNTGVTPNVDIQPLTFKQADLANIYDTSTKFLKLEDAFGLKVAVFCYGTKKCVSFAGTRLDFTGIKKSVVSMQNILTDVIQIVYKPTPAYMAAVGIVDALLNDNNEHVFVFGHSLGGGLTQFACAANSTTRVHGNGYNSAGLSASTCDILTKHGAYVPLGNIVHINASTDVVSKIGTFLGERVNVDTAGINIMGAHKIETLNMVINKGGMLYC